MAIRVQGCTQQEFGNLHFSELLPAVLLLCIILTVLWCCYSWLDEIQRIVQPDYTPTEMDIIHMRRMTKTPTHADMTVTVQNMCHQQGISFQLHITDVGGQRQHQEEWLSCARHVDLILYVVALSDFNSSLRSGQVS